MLRPAKARCDKLRFGQDAAQAARGSACTKSFARRTRTYNSWLLVAAKCRLMAQGCSTHCASAEVFFLSQPSMMIFEAGKTMQSRDTINLTRDPQYVGVASSSESPAGCDGQCCSRAKRSLR